MDSKNFRRFALKTGKNMQMGMENCLASRRPDVPTNSKPIGISRFKVLTCNIQRLANFGPFIGV